MDSFGKSLLGADSMSITVLGTGARSVFVSDEINKQNLHLWVGPLPFVSSSPTAPGKKVGVDDPVFLHV